ncbi:synaptic vesicle glycoprotein 2B-like [Plodia interpunctella]|uniref:synaptic vesicle glycoprotein 2B-like n=1 Tax=Plodia interpunctella TaxID=58824 RepID=UPI002367660B|nr:synaptic vesicle glycoprotein 2B-like [Plodia interpunctella]
MSQKLVVIAEDGRRVQFKNARVEDALSIAGFGKYNIFLLLLCSWILQAMGMDLFGSTFVIAAAVCDLEINMQQRALLTAMPLVGVVVGAQLWGYISDTKGRRLTLMLSMSMGFVFGAASSFAADWRLMAVLKLFSSTFTSASNSAAYALLGECCPLRVRGRAMLLGTVALMCAQGTVAGFAYPILPLDFSYWIDFLGINYRPWRLLGLVMAMPCAITACLLNLVYESPKFLAAQGRFDEALAVLKNIYSINEGKDADDFPVNMLISDKEYQATKGDESLFRSLWNQTFPLFRPPLLKRTLHLFSLVIIIYVTGSGFILWLPYIMNSLFTLEAGEGSGMNICNVIAYSADHQEINVNGTITVCNDTIQPLTLISAICYGALASSCTLVMSLTCGSRKRIGIMFILTISACSAVLMNIVHVPMAGGVFFCFFLISAVTMGILSVYFVEVYPTSLTGMVSCLAVMVGRTSAFFGANAIGALISYDCETTFYGWAALLMCAVVIAWFLPKDKKTEK